MSIYSNTYGRLVRQAAIIALLIGQCAIASAQFHLHDVEIVVAINELGNARISETRYVTVGNKGSEGYIRQKMRQGREVGEIAVSDETGTQYQVVSPWNINLSREEKANKCGIYEGDEGTELCWGVGNAGQRIYHVHYTLTRLVKSYEDFDGFIFTFYEAASPHAQHLRVTIYREGKPFTTDDTRVWSFNHYGTIFVKDGKIVAETTKPFAVDGEKMNIMVQFNKGLFKPVTQVKQTFYKAVRKKALEGSDYDDLEKQKGKSSYVNGEFSGDADWDFLVDFCHDALAVILAIIFPFYAIGMRSMAKDRKKDLKDIKRLFGNTDKRMENWFRDIPLKGDLNKAAGVLKAIDSGLYAEDNLRKAYILRMIYNKQLQIVINNDSHGRAVKMFYVTDPDAKSYDNQNNTDYSAYLHSLLYEAAGTDHVLQPKELEGYAEKSPVKLRPMAKNLSRALSVPTYRLSTLSKKQVNEVMGLKKFLEEFTLNNERTIEEVQLWKDYLVYATLYGNAEQVSRDMKKVFPAFKELANIESFTYETDTLWMANELSVATQNAILYVRGYETPQERQSRLAREEAARRSSYSSSGGGGSSSYSGGGGSDGGGGSGFR